MAGLNPLDAKKLKGESFDIEVKAPQKCEHGGSFKYVTPREIECQKCHVGFVLSGSDRLIDGHLYSSDKLVN